MPGALKSLAGRTSFILSQPDLSGHGSYGVSGGGKLFRQNVEQRPADKLFWPVRRLRAIPPYQNYPKARERQKYVLGRMVEMYIIAPRRARRWRKRTIHPASILMPSGHRICEQIRRYLEEVRCRDFYTDGCKFTPHEPGDAAGGRRCTGKFAGA
jgi:penicillin-binding protein 1A